jgi:hypothetical protein
MSEMQSRAVLFRKTSFAHDLGTGSCGTISIAEAFYWTTTSPMPELTEDQMLKKAKELCRRDGRPGA